MRVNPSDEGIARAVSTVAQKCDASEFVGLAANMEAGCVRTRVDQACCGYVYVLKSAFHAGKQMNLSH